MPEKKSPLPVPSGRYLEMEAASSWGYTLCTWQAESVHNKAQVLAHFLHRTMRDAYNDEKLSTKPPKGKPTGGTLAGLMKGLGIG